MTEQVPIDVRNKISELNAFLAKKGLKRTRQRDLIAEIVLEANGHIGVEEIYRRVKKKNPKVGFSTVYRTMKLLTEIGLVSERHFGDGQARYEAVREGEHHDHLICTSCGDIVEFEDEAIEERQDLVAQKHGFQVLSHKHEIYGVCPRCLAKAATARPVKRTGKRPS